MADGKNTLIHLLSSNSWGGVERYAFDICRHFKKEGWNVLAVTRDAKAVDKLFEKEEIPLLHAPLWSMFDFHSVRLLAQTLNKNPDGLTVVHAHGFRNACSALLAKKLSGKQNVKVVMTRHKVKRGLDTWILNRVYRQIDSMIFVSELSKERFLSTWSSENSPFQDSNLCVIHNSINIPDMPYLPRENKGPVMAMFHGPLRVGKGLETLIDALSMVKSKRLRLRIVGAGRPDYVDCLRRRAIKKGVMDMIDWHRQVDDPMPLIENSDFGILPSQTEEAFGLSNIEYMAAGRAQIASSNGAQSEYITHSREGILVPPGNAFLLADAIKKLLTDADLRIKMGVTAYETFRNTLSWKNFIKKLLPVYYG